VLHFPAAGSIQAVCLSLSQSMCVIVYCRVLPCAAMFCCVLQPASDPLSFPFSEHVLQCVAVCCSVMQLTPLRSCASLFPRSCVLQCVAVCCSVLQCVDVAVCCSVLMCVAVYCSVLQCVAMC